MKILADRAIPYVDDFFRAIGDVTLCNGRDIDNANLSDVDILVVRTVTPVTPGLLGNTGVRFVASATSGHDHVDLGWLREQGIGFAGAPGCNARSVAEYVLSCLLVLAGQDGFDLYGRSVGIIGCGHVGSVLLDFLESLGITCLVYDPPRQARGDSLPFCRFDEVLSADIITLHVPLVGEGPYPTWRLVDRNFLSRVRPDVILLNTSRGAVADEQALAAFADASPRARLIIDVWENEPDINSGLLERAWITTPHIAGYSADGRLRAVTEVFGQVCHYFGLPCNEPVSAVLPGGKTRVDISRCNTELDAVRMAVVNGYDIRRDSAVLKRMLDLELHERGDFFSRLRADYPVRREFPAVTVSVPESAGVLQEKLIRLGFNVTC